jgi:predicted HTH transcriptional regulator
MAESLNLKHLLELLVARNFESLIGLIESDEVEAKSQPYTVQTNERGKLELAKDVSGLANERGGIILIGPRTQKSDLHPGDEVTEISLVAKDLVNLEQYHKIIDSWIYPKPEEVNIEYLPSLKNPEVGLFAIKVAQQSEARKPFLITHSLFDDRRADIVFGFVRRVRSDVQPTTVQDLYALMRDGRRFDEITQRLDTVQTHVLEMAARLHASEVDVLAGTKPSITRDEVLSRLNEATRIIGLNPNE